MNFISYGKQLLDKSDKEAVLRVLNSDFLTQGPEVLSFEKALCEKTGAKYAVAVSNGTAALHLAVLALEIKAGSEGITSPITFAASANCLLYGALVPKFADIDPLTCNIDPKEIEKQITRKTRLIIPVHFRGLACNMKEIRRIARKHSLYVIEDASHAIGSNYADGSRVGNCKYSDMAVFSFHPVKTITTGEGGAITTNSKSLYEKLFLLRTHGITKDSKKLSKNEGPWYYEMQKLGFNHRLTDMQAALGVSQLKKLNKFKARRRAIVTAYNKAFAGLHNITLPYEAKNQNSCFHLYVIKIDFKAIKKTRAEVMLELKKMGIGTQVHYIPVHFQPYYQALGFKKGICPEAEEFYEQALSLPLFAAMKKSQVDFVIKNFLEAIRG
ncbi:MAG: UDP-4-amino-4,6-dideoxy-N-acetyl-beta-L-altrosamine transaminase [bacterium]